MIFANPYFLILIPVVWIIAGANFMFSRRLTATIRLPMPANTRLPRTYRADLSVFIKYFLRTTALSLMILALARPQKISKGAIPPAEGVDILLCLDTSSSMSALDFDPFNRLEAAKKAALDFIRRRNSDRMGIAVFSANALLQCPLTLDYDSLVEFLDEVKIGMTHSDGTAIGDAIATSVNHLKNNPAKSKVLILLTDGRSNTGVVSDPVTAAKTAASYGIKIYTIGTAGKGPAKIAFNDPVFGLTYGTINEDLDEGTLMAISAATEGEFFRATNYRELQGIYGKIDALEKTKFNGTRTLNYSDKYLSLLILAAICLLMELTAEHFLFLRVPYCSDTLLYSSGPLQPAVRLLPYSFCRKYAGISFWAGSGRLQPFGVLYTLT